MHRSRSNGKVIQDLELRLGPSFPPKGRMLASSYARGFPNLITIEDDDDDDVQILFPSSPAEALRLFPCSSSWVPIISEEDLELRLGVKAHDGFSGNSSGSMINVPDDGAKDPSQRKFGQQSSNHSTLEEKEVRLRCAICMDTMKEETSTICGHIFCKYCITNAIRVQKRCPACREKLSPANIHRIYLPGATS
ncbi:uncharacterized RING finger protein C548.05c-like isoform X4 [Magnolia sinica]|uniref:uncharacterized RING finger protein C548.05c-like isoform X4 n=1 Tax=Magnolia sinica TaxID=86752 RepID=UPI002657D9D6|nr:uncharacterized RING finger protein C548.05c-like isoform X4 [Magnolia sinica]